MTSDINPPQPGTKRGAKHPVGRILVPFLAVIVIALSGFLAWLFLAPADPGGGDAVDRQPAAVSVPPPTRRDQPCPDGWLCLYENSNFNRDRDGRMLQFQDDVWQSFDMWQFANQASSMRNRLGRDGCLSRQWPPGADLLTVTAGADLADLGSWDDQTRGIKPGPC